MAHGRTLPEVIVPWQGGCPHREAAWRYVEACYAGWPIRVAELGGPWVKANAVMPAIEASTSDVVVVADADCFTAGLECAVHAVHDGAEWAIPHYRVKRLTETSTRRVLDGELPDRLALEEPPYVGAPTGGVLVIRRTTALDIPMDPRFVGWGGEDRSWGRALRLLVGEPWRGRTNLFHLWHPPQAREDRNHGRAETEALRRRYLLARQHPDQMRALLEEARCQPTSPSSTT